MSHRGDRRRWGGMRAFFKRHTAEALAVDVIAFFYMDEMSIITFRFESVQQDRGKH